MRVFVDESLKKHTTIGIGGNANNFFVPENVEELFDLLKLYPDSKIISAGSNLLINDAHNFENVIYMGKVDENICDLGEGIFYCGASVHIQKLIKAINALGYGGIEELISIPGMLGGLIYMNASIGNDDICLSSYLEKVYAIRNNKKITFLKGECQFGHRSSIFQKEPIIITGAIFKFPSQSLQKSEERIRNRYKRVKETQDYSGANFGSLFKECDYRLMEHLKYFNIKSGGVRLSAKTTNWIVHDGSGSYRDVQRVIKVCKIIHKCFFKKALLEVVVWE